MLSGLIGKEDYASLKRRAQDRNQWRNWIIKNEGQELLISRAHKKNIIPLITYRYVKCNKTFKNRL